jgi:GPN-loop GTPase
VHLVDAHLTSDPGKYLAAALLSLSTMLHLGLPHINVLSKVCAAAVAALRGIRCHV